MFAFVLMPFDASFDDIYKLGIKEPAEALGIRAERVDEQIFYKENILERIINQINSADLIIADLTGRNPNVFYETGYAHAKNKTCLLLTSNADDIPFDLKHHRHIVYGTSIQTLRQSIENNLSRLQLDIANRTSTIAVTLKSLSGQLKKSPYNAEAEVEIIFDLHNHTTVPSAEIEAIYFYTGKSWEFTQDGQKCLSTSSDMEGFTERHFVRSPVRRMQAGSWAQFKLAGTKIVEWSSPKSELKDEYRINGKGLVKTITDDGAYEFPVALDIKITEWPF